MSATPFDNLQPSLALNEVMIEFGSYPATGVINTDGDDLGFVYDFAGYYVPDDSLDANGGFVGIVENQLLYNLIGGTYGGDIGHYFALPNLDGNVAIGEDSSYALGAETGSSSVTLTNAQLPAPTGGGQSFDNLQPSLPLQTLIDVVGNYPNTSGTPEPTFIGEIAEFAAGFTPDGWLPADGQTLSVNQNLALFSVIGSAYGGNGATTFRLPNLQGSVAVGADAAHPLGTSFGQASTTLTNGQLPPGGAPVNNDQPSVAVNYLIAIQGAVTNVDGSGFSATSPILGEVVATASPIVPAGWALADGQLLSIRQYQTLFAVIGTIYGGDGISTFALPNLEGRAVIGAEGSTYALGGVYGSDTTTLAADNIPCFGRGTLILTDRGEVAVEDLQIGDRVVTAAGEARPIRWLGHRRVDCDRHPDPESVWPIRVAAHAFGENRPHRELWLSPGHNIAAEGVLIPIKALQNGKSIVQVARPRVEYRHVELDSHDILLAQGLPAESFLDTGNRAAFANGADFIAAHPDVEPKPWTQTRAPLVFEGPPVWRAKAALLERLRAQGCDTTSDADLHVIANGKRIDAVQLEARRVYVVIPAGVSDAVLKSRTFIPAHAVADSDDTRKLGICVKRFQIDGEDVAIDSPDLSDADWHAPEPAHRWTRGAVALPANIRVVLIDLAEDALYWREPRDNVVALFG